MLLEIEVNDELHAALCREAGVRPGHIAHGNVERLLWHGLTWRRRIEDAAVERERADFEALMEGWGTP